MTFARAQMMAARRDAVQLNRFRAGHLIGPAPGAEDDALGSQLIERHELGGALAVEADSEFSHRKPRW